MRKYYVGMDVHKLSLAADARWHASEVTSFVQPGCGSRAAAEGYRYVLLAQL